ncbi:hypothetical protein NKJ71_09670 [Mesorhizobium sp. M0050]|uniref:glycoside hydrolase family 19 protein n=1 Tax=Mesorhizobium sp. M0050 TaxID=2956861 RepID=UPI003336C8C3
MGRAAVTFLVAMLCLGKIDVSSAGSISDAITVDNIVKMSPHARADLVDALVRDKKQLEGAGITNPNRLYQFMAEIATESAGFTTLEENLNYTKDGLRRVFRKYFLESELATFAHRREAIANRVYANRMKNGPEASGDGWKFRGSGYIQLTGRRNFEAVANLPVVVDLRDSNNHGLMSNTDLARQPVGSLTIATAFWKKANVNGSADEGKTELVRRAINGGVNGLAQTKLWLAQAKRAFGPSLQGRLEAANINHEADTEEAQAIREILAQLGLYKSTGLESPQDQAAFKLAVGKFVAEEGLPEGAGGTESASDKPISPELLYGLTDFALFADEREKELPQD